MLLGWPFSCFVRLLKRLACHSVAALPGPLYMSLDQQWHYHGCLCQLACAIADVSVSNEFST
jgi:hypothetical protein